MSIIIEHWTNGDRLVYTQRRQRQVGWGVLPHGWAKRKEIGKVEKVPVHERNKKNSKVEFLADFGEEERKAWSTSPGDLGPRARDWLYI